ncbi:MAG: GxxExxY protein [bacterium]
MSELIYKQESYMIIGICFEVYNKLGRGFLEVVYKDAIEYELNINKIPYTREKSYDIVYKDILLKHKYNADFVIFDKIILEIKSTKQIINSDIKQTLNYLSVSNLKLGIVINLVKTL